MIVSVVKTSFTDFVTTVFLIEKEYDVTFTDKDEQKLNLLGFIPRRSAAINKI